MWLCTNCQAYSTDIDITDIPDIPEVCPNCNKSYIYKVKSGHPKGILYQIDEFKATVDRMFNPEVERLELPEWNETLSFDDLEQNEKVLIENTSKYKQMQEPHLYGPMIVSEMNKRFLHTFMDEID